MEQYFTLISKLGRLHVPELLLSLFKVIHRDHDAAVYALSTHPSAEYLAVGSYSGLLKIWNYETKTVIASRKFDKNLMIRCIQHDPKGQFIGK